MCSRGLRWSPVAWPGPHCLAESWNVIHSFEVSYLDLGYCSSFMLFE